MKRMLALFAASALTLAACGGAVDEPETPTATTLAAQTSTTTTTEAPMADPMADGEPVTFRVTIENVAPVTPYTDSGTFAVPVGSDDPGPLLPGAAYEFAVNANPGQRVSFASMLVQSNDWFFAAGSAGLELYSADGTPISGDVTSQISLYDAGTEVDQTPGSGEDQAPRQSGADTGAADPDATVRVVDADLPAIDALISVTVAPAADGEFVIRIENLSDASAFATPLAPGAFAVHSDGEPLFTVGEADRGQGLAALAEDGDPSGLAGNLAAGVGLGVPLPLAPGLYAVQTAMGEDMMDHAQVFFTHGEADRGGRTRGTRRRRRPSSTGRVADWHGRGWGCRSLLGSSRGNQSRTAATRWHL